jgi:type IV pilus assembly protein PilW
MRERGFSLLELLMVAGLGSLFLLIVFQLFSYQQQEYHHQQALLITQENTRIALQLLQKNLQAAGEAGCQSGVDLLLANQVAQLPMPIRLLQGYTVYGGQTEGIIVEKASYERSSLSQAMMHSDDPIYLTQKKIFNPGEIVLIADCTHADLFMISSIDQDHILQHITPANHSAHLNHVYGLDAQVMRWQIDSYYISPSSRDENIWALYQHRLLPKQSTVELISGIHQFTVQYAFMLQGVPEFLQANSVTDWTKLRGLLLHVLGYSPHSVGKTFPYFWLGEKITPINAGVYWPAQLNVVLYNQ